MSTHPPSKPSQPDDQQVTLPRIAEMKRDGEPIVMITAYDYPSAQIVDEAGFAIGLARGTAAIAVLGYPGRTPASTGGTLMLARVDIRGAKPAQPVSDRSFR